MENLIWELKCDVCGNVCGKIEVPADRHAEEDLSNESFGVKKVNCDEHK